MTDKEEIKFAIRYLKQGLKSKRTPPLYEELMNELGFVSNKELDKLKGKLEDLTSEYYELENLKNNEIAELKKRNAEFDCQKNRNKSCYSCANATERCFRNEIGCPCQKYKSYKEENAELKAYNEKLLDGDIEKHNKIVELKEQIDALANVNIKAQNIIGEAKEIIRQLCSMVRELNNPNVQLTNVDYSLSDAEQFISEVEK